MPASQRDSSAQVPPPGAGRPKGPDAAGDLLALIGKLGNAASTPRERELVAQLHRIMVLRVLRRAGGALIIWQVAARTGLGIYTAEDALESLREQGAATRDTASPASRYRAVPRKPPADPGSSAPETVAQVAGATAGQPARPGDPPPAPGPESGADPTVSPAAALAAALHPYGVTAEVTGHGVRVTAGEQPPLQVATALTASGSPVWSWRRGAGQYQHPRHDPAGAAALITACLNLPAQ